MQHQGWVALLAQGLQQGLATIGGNAVHQKQQRFPVAGLLPDPALLWP